jgi:hypothetical protein
MLPIRRLPVEILCRVLTACKSTVPLRDWPLRLLDLTHVSSTWRSTARSFPSLWTVIDLDQESLAHKSLILSKPLPVSTFRDVHSTSDWADVFQLWRHSKRVDLNLYTETWFEELDELISTPAPRLQSISLQVLTDSDDDDVETVDAEIPGPDEAPNLMSVRLNFFTESLHLCALRALDLSNIKNPPSLITLHNVLANQEQLELLCLVDSIAEMAVDLDIPHINQWPAQLKNLQLLKVQTDVDVMHVLLRSIALGPHTRISLIGDMSGSSYDDLLDLSEHTATLVRLMPDCPWLEISARCARNQYHLVVRSEESENEPAILSLQSRIPDEGYAIDVLVKALNVIGGRVHTLRLDKLDLGIYGRPFPELPHVHTVEAIGPAADKVLEYLILDSRRNSQDICWPNLSHLKLCAPLMLDYGGSLWEALPKREHLTGRRLSSLHLNRFENLGAAKVLADSVYPGSYEDAQQSQKVVFIDVDFDAMLDQLVECQFGTSQSPMKLI